MSFCQQLSAYADQVRANLSVSAAQVEYVELSTKDQSNSIVWHEHRAGRNIALFSHSVLQTNQDHLAPSVIKVITALHLQPVMALSLVYGRDNELRVFSMMGSVIPSTHMNCTVCHTGMQISIKHPWRSASGDGIITCECHHQCVLQIKYPLTLVNAWGHI